VLYLDGKDEAPPRLDHNIGIAVIVSDNYAVEDFLPHSAKSVSSMLPFAQPRAFSNLVFISGELLAADPVGRVAGTPRGGIRFMLTAAALGTFQVRSPRR